MAFFKFRLPGQSNSNASPEAVHNAPAQSLEVLRKRARHRLIGSVVLVLAAVIGFPLLFDTQPRPVALDTAIVTPERNSAPSAPPVAVSAPVTSVAGAVSRPAVVANAPTAGLLPPAGVLDANEEVVAATPRPTEKPARLVEAAALATSPTANSGGFNRAGNGKFGARLGRPDAYITARIVL